MLLREKRRAPYPEPEVSAVSGDGTLIRKNSCPRAVLWPFDFIYLKGLKKK